MKKTVIWIGALVVGAILGLLGLDRINDLMDFIATVYVRLFQLLAVPTIVLAITTTLATLGSGPDAGRIFRHTISYTLLTTLVAAAVGLLLYVIIAPGNMQLPVADSELPIVDSQVTYTDHLLSVIPNNIVKPFLEGNVLSLLILAAAIGIALSQIADTPQKKTVVNFLQGVQEVLFTLIRGLIVILPVGIVAFAAQLSAQLSAGVIADSLGKYVAVVQPIAVLRGAAHLPVDSPPEPYPRDVEDDTCHPDGTLHQEQCRNTARHDGDSRETVGHTAKGGSLRVTHLHHHQHERLCSLHIGDVIVCDATRRHRTLLAHHADMVAHLGGVGHRQCGCSHGMLFPHPLADVGHQRTYCRLGNHTAHLYHHRHGRDCCQRVERFVCLRHDRPRPQGQKLSVTPSPVTSSSASLPTSMGKLRMWR